MRERFALRQVFRISRGARTHADVVSVAIADGAHTGRGECVPYARYGETLESVAAQIEGLPEGVVRADLPGLLPAGAARNAVDCALWDLEAARALQLPFVGLETTGHGAEMTRHLQAVAADHQGDAK